MATIDTLAGDLFIVTTHDGDNNLGGCVISSVAQVTSSPKKIIISVSKNNKTCEMLDTVKTFHLLALSENFPMDTFNLFGYRTSFELNKFENLSYTLDINSNPILEGEIISSFVCWIVETVDLGTHNLYIALVDEEISYDNVSTNPLVFEKISEKGLTAPVNATCFLPEQN